MDIRNNPLKEWVAILRETISVSSPELLQLFDIYATEAKFGREFIADRLENLSFNASVLEVGAGSLILSSQLVREGYQVTALEPIGGGFSHFEKLRQLVLQQALAYKCLPKLLEIPAEHLEVSEQFDFAFSINVMEHVSNVNQVIKTVGNSLKDGACYKFTCPNYTFPYEPHFNIPTLLSKKLTERVFNKKIHNSQNIDNPTELWQSLNWITVLQVRKFLSNLSEFKVTFGRELLQVMILRALNDRQFSSRRSVWLKNWLNVFVKLGLHKLTSIMPAIFQPVIDCTVTKIPRRVEM